MPDRIAAPALLPPRPIAQQERQRKSSKDGDVLNSESLGQEKCSRHNPAKIPLVHPAKEGVQGERLKNTQRHIVLGHAAGPVHKRHRRGEYRA
jgi:hypothetical protein